MRIRQYLSVLAPTLALVATVFAWAENKTPGATESVRWATFETTAGEQFFALSLSPNAPLPVAKAHDVLVFIDTSATQTGSYRQQSTTVLNSLLESLPDTARVQIVAVDVNAVPLMKGFSASQSEETKAALAKLAKRAPLGATDLNAAINYAKSAFEGNQAARSMVYVGDGMCRASLLNGREINQQAKALIEAKISVTSCAVGVERNASLLAALANLSGGQLVEANPGEMTAEKAGQALAAMTATPIAWPTEVKLPASVAEMYPAQLPPLRADRDTIVIGRLKQGAAGDVQVKANVSGESINFTWNVAPEKSHPDFAFLPKLVESAKADQGATLPTLGSTGLRVAARNLVQTADELVELGKKALSMGNSEGAKRVADEALKRDPQNPKAKALLELATRGTTDIVMQNAGGELSLGGEAKEEPKTSGLLERFEKQEGLFLGSVEQDRSVKAGLVKAQVEETLKSTRQLVSEGDHEGAIAQLKLELEKVERTTELDPETRSNLRDRLIVASREASRRGVSIEYQRTEKEQRIAQALEMQRVRSELANKEQKLTQLMQRFDSLMAERRYKDAEDDVVPEIAKLVPDTAMEQSATWWGDFKHNSYEFDKLVFLRYQKFNDTLFQVELSHVPLPDEPPVIYPSFEKWEDITERRKKWKSVDLVKPGSAEAKIADQLLQEVTIEEPEIELGRLMETIASRQDITIVFDPVGLEEAGVTTDQIVSHNLKGISLRSALRLILGPLNLTYVIKDEVLQITSVEKASEQLVTKVYPVGDLVVPILSNLGGGGGGFGVGAGQGGGGFGGGGGGGLGGGGGGGFGGGGGGFGGGAFDVQDELSLTAVKTAATPTAPAAAEQPKVRRPQAATNVEIQPIRLQLSSGESTEAAWDRYFADLAKQLSTADEKATAQAEAAVRETVRQMRAKQDFAGISALILSALRNGQAQPWMYETLSIAMHAQDAPVEDIERALMSGVDLADNLDQVQYLALYMSKTGLEKAALKLYRQLAALQPTRPEFYTQGLACARAVNDREGIMWACEGILQQAWENRYRHMEQEALNEGKAMILALEKENKLTEAKDFENRLRAALARDCRVRISWTGDADLDLQMEEPAGTSCSVKIPRSVSGGVFLGDSFATNGKTPLEGYSESYVCPQAFAGEYRMLIKRVWGKVTTGKVTVDITLHQGTPQEKKFRQQIELGEKPAMVVFNVDAGRRQEPLAEEQIAHVARMQNALGRQILAQQIGNIPGGGIVGPGTLSGYNPGFGVNGVNGMDPRLLAYLSGRSGAVGFNIRPTILREGLEMFSNAVISADRRYVRVTPSPSITAIGQVTTFNVATGNVGSGTLDANGGGGGGNGGNFGGGTGS